MVKKNKAKSKYQQEMVDVIDKKFLNKTRVPRMNNEIPSGKTPYLRV